MKLHRIAFAGIACGNEMLPYEILCTRILVILWKGVVVLQWCQSSLSLVVMMVCGVEVVVGMLEQA